MIILDYTKKHHKKIIHACVEALKQGKVVAYPTDTCYGLAANVNNIHAIKKLYKIKGRDFKKPSSVVVPSAAYAKNITIWPKTALKLVKKLWPGAITLVLSVKDKELRKKEIKMLSANTGLLGLRQPKNDIALELAKSLKSPITATSANLSGEPECYSAEEIIKQFNEQKNKPDIIINAGKLKKNKPSTVMVVSEEKVDILREGPVSESQIQKILNYKSLPAGRQVKS